jgi:predicted AAA+ superfamily ATPase
VLTQDLLQYINLANPWLNDKNHFIINEKDFIHRIQTEQLIKPTWDRYITVLTGPRQAGKTTLGRIVSQQVIQEGRFPILLYLNCDEFSVRQWLTGSHILLDLQRLLKTKIFILFLDEIQRLESPGLLLKSLYDLKTPNKIIATGSSQLEIKSKVQEYLTGRDTESVILPLSYLELGPKFDPLRTPIYGCYPQIVQETEKQFLLQNLFQHYINKDIIEVLKIKNADVMRHLLTLVAHSSGQLVNYQQLATDCRVSTPTIIHYLSILENTYVLYALKPFVGNKRTEITSNPMYYFIDNGFRNQSLNNFLPLEQRTDKGLLIQSAVFQELYKYKVQHYLEVQLYYWRTKGGAEVDFVWYQNAENIIPIEVKYQQLKTAKISRSFASFLLAYRPKRAVVITKETTDFSRFEECDVYFIPFAQLTQIFEILNLS